MEVSSMNFVFNIDGTLCFNGQTIEEPITTALSTLIQAKHRVTFTSTRPIRDLEPLIPSALRFCNLIAGNGCFIRQNNVISVEKLQEEVVQAIITIVEEEKLTYFADGVWNYTFTGGYDHPILKNINQSTAKNVPLQQLGAISKIILFNPTEKALQRLSFLPIVTTYYKNEQALDIRPSRVNKVAGLNVLNIDEYVVFGNDANDQCMFEHAFFSVCVGDHEVRKYASLNILKEEVADTIYFLSQKLITIH
jgi:HAD superfamily hydrolase (TIGR01484 family)